MILRSHSPGAGLFSHINFIVTHLQCRDEKNIHVDWTEGLPYSEPGRGNLFESLFKQFSDRRTQDVECSNWPHYNYTFKNAWRLYNSDDRWRSELNRCWAKFVVQPSILSEVENFRSSWPSRVVGLHIRNLNISSECPGSLGPSLDDYLHALDGIDAPVFLATDNVEAVEFFRNALGERLITREIPRSKDMLTEYHLTTKQTFEDAKNCLIDALILAGCQLFIHSVSNIATAVLYMNPSLPHIPLLARPSLHNSKDAQETAEPSVGGDSSHSSLILIEHPGWTDWILLREDGSYHRHNQPSEGGTWQPSADNRIVLHWNDWPSEEFEPEEEIYRYGAARNGVNAVNSLCYRLVDG